MQGSSTGRARPARAEPEVTPALASLLAQWLFAGCGANRAHGLRHRVGSATTFEQLRQLRPSLHDEIARQLGEAESLARIRRLDQLVLQLEPPQPRAGPGRGTLWQWVGAIISPPFANRGIRHGPDGLHQEAVHRHHPVDGGR